MKRAAYRAAALVALALTLGAAPALRADPPPSPAQPTEASSRRQDRNERLRRRLEHLLEKGAAGAPSAAPSGAVPSAEPGALPAPAGSIGAPALELARKWAELASSRAARGSRHRAALVRDFGERLQDPALRAELAVHSKRLAELRRLEFLAKNARTGAERDKLLSRIQRLVEREAARHRQRLLDLTSAPAASALPAPSAPPAAGREAPR